MSKRWVILLLGALVLALIYAFSHSSFDFGNLGNILSGSAVNSADEFVGLKYVSKIIDGDTVIIEGSSVRLLGMDTDEKGEPCWKSAKERITELVLNKEVDVVAEKNVNKDQYKRYLRYIFLNGTNIDLQLVQEGLAVARVEDSSYAQEFVDAEKIARENKVGCKWNMMG